MKTKPASVIITFITQFAVCCWVFTVHAQDPLQSESSAALMENVAPTIEQVVEQRATVEVDTSLSEAQKATALSLYDRAQRAIRAVAELDAQAAAMRRRVSVAPARIAELSAQIELESQPFDVAPERYAEAGAGRADRDRATRLRDRLGNTPRTS